MYLKNRPFIQLLFFIMTVVLLSGCRFRKETGNSQKPESTLAAGSAQGGNSPQNGTSSRDGEATQGGSSSRDGKPTQGGFSRDADSPQGGDSSETDDSGLPLPGLPAGFAAEDVPSFSGTAWVDVHEDVPFFSEPEMAAARGMIAELLKTETKGLQSRGAKEGAQETDSAGQGSPKGTDSEGENQAGEEGLLKTGSAREGSPQETDSAGESGQEDPGRNGWQRYGALDSLGRCTGAVALVGPETLPQSERESIANIKPTGWHTVKYDGIDGNYLYNRCHLIGFQLTGQNANARNLITGTRFMNIEGMLPYEDSVLAYVAGTGKHVLYRVTPVFEGRNLLADGVLMEARSVEDPLVQFCAFCYNVQPEVQIDYATGESEGVPFSGTDTKTEKTASGKESGSEAEGKSPEAGSEAGGGSPGAGSGTDGKSTEAGSEAGGSSPEVSSEAVADEPGTASETAPDTSGTSSKKTWDYIVNVSSLIFHLPDCPSVEKMSRKNRQGFNGSRQELIDMGYVPCNYCRP
ncbi:MAG: DNA/RNA non-specific endonuclease [Eubacteriales bacterium]|nr:DNA/RNA non-specific endonuclease [Eubacteriales bacterium]